MNKIINNIFFSTGKGKRLIITHIGNENGFVEGGLLVFESKKTGDYHNDMNSNVFEEWFSNILDILPENAIIVMDNASYHSRKLETIPTATTKKEKIFQWLMAKNIAFEKDMLKRELLKIVKEHKHIYDLYVIDEMAKQKNKKVLRLPPYHCELNPIELIWAQVKGYVASKNTSFKLNDTKKYFYEAISMVDSRKWHKCVRHVIEVVEPQMNVMDENMEKMHEKFLINLKDDSSDSDSE